MTIRWGLGVMLGVYVAGCSGGHLNPAVTFVNCLYRGFPWRKWFPYACAQVLGCFSGAAIIYANYRSAIDAYEGGSNIRTVPGYSDHATANVFCTFPQPFMERVGMFFSEFIASAVLIFVIFALKGISVLLLVVSCAQLMQMQMMQTLAPVTSYHLRSSF